MGMKPVVYYVSDPVVRVETQDDLWRQLREERSLSVVTYASALPELRRLGKATVTRQVRDLREPNGSVFDRIVFLELTQRKRPERMAAKPVASRY
jgi:hypothetical protein